MRIIWKHTLNTPYHSSILSGMQDIELIHVGLDAEGVPCAWTSGFPDESGRGDAIKVRVVGTGGNEIDDWEKHVGSFVQPPYVWHVYQDTRFS